MRRNHPSGLLLLFVLAAAGCDRFYVVHGTVRDCVDQRPIANADVQLALSSDGQLKHGETSSAADGSFVAVLNEPESDLASVLTVLKAGYAPLTYDVTYPQLPQDVCLEPSSP